MKDTKAEFVKYSPQSHLDALKNSAEEVAKNILPVVEKMFWYLTLFTLVYVVGQNLIFKTQDFATFFSTFLKWVITTGIFYFFIKNASDFCGKALDWSISSGAALAGGAKGQVGFLWFIETGLAITADSIKNSFAPLAEFSFEIKIDWDSLLKFELPNPEVGTFFSTLAIAAIMIILSLIICAFVLVFLTTMGIKFIIVQIMGYLVLYFGVLCLGLSGHPAGRQILVSYYKKAFAILMQLFTMCAFAIMIQKYVNAVINGESSFANIPALLVMALMLYLLLEIFDILPGKVAAIMGVGGVAETFSVKRATKTVVRIGVAVVTGGASDAVERARKAMKAANKAGMKGLNKAAFVALKVGGGTGRVGKDLMNAGGSVLKNMGMSRSSLGNDFKRAFDAYRKLS